MFLLRHSGRAEGAVSMGRGRLSSSEGCWKGGGKESVKKQVLSRTFCSDNEGEIGGA